jgi:hypothetical protein
MRCIVMEISFSRLSRVSDFILFLHLQCNCFAYYRSQLREDKEITVQIWKIQACRKARDAEDLKNKPTDAFLCRPRVGLPGVPD